jgi:hypothetical protein
VGNHFSIRNRPSSPVSFSFLPKIGLTKKFNLALQERLLWSRKRDTDGGGLTPVLASVATFGTTFIFMAAGATPYEENGKENADKPIFNFAGFHEAPP